jgi:hypothetical protein
MPTLPELKGFYKAHGGLINLIGLAIGFISLWKRLEEIRQRS